MNNGLGQNNSNLSYGVGDIDHQNIVKNKSWGIKKILGLIILLIVIIFGIIVVFGQIVRIQKKNIALDKAQQYFNDLNEGDYIEVYQNWFSEEFQRELTQEDFTASAEMIDVLIGKNIKRDLSTWTTESDPSSGSMIILLKYNSEFEKDNNVEETLNFLNNAVKNTWQVSYYQLKSNKIKDLQKME